MQSNKQIVSSYTLGQLFRDLWVVRDTPLKGVRGRLRWGSDPADSGEGLAFIESGEVLFEKGKYEGEVGLDMVNIDKELALIEAAIAKAIEKCTIEVVSQPTKNTYL